MFELALASLDEVFRSSENERMPRRTKWRQLRGLIWLEHAMWSNGLTSEEFSKRCIIRNRSSSKLIRKWLESEAYPVRRSALEVEKVLPNTLWMFDHPVFELLAEVPPSPSRISAFIAPYRHIENITFDFVTGSCDAKRYAWQFPGDSDDDVHWIYLNPNWIDDLLERGDWWAFFAILALTRKAEVKKQYLEQYSLCQKLFRILPSILKVPWVAPHKDLLVDCLHIVKSRMWPSKFFFEVDFDVINKYAADPAYEPKRELRARDPKTQRFVEYDDPILYARLISGQRIKELKLKKIQRSETGKIQLIRKR